MANTDGMGEFISLPEAITYTAAFRSKYADLPKAHLAGKDKLIELLNQADCIGVRIYNGVDPETGKMNLVIVGMDGTGSDMTDGLILEKFGFCPPVCDVKSPLQ